MHRESFKIRDIEIPITRTNTVIVGAGAAGMNCAVQLVNQWKSNGVENPHERVLVVTGGLELGASRMSGSDKQTYYKLGTSPRVPDTPADFAKTLTAFGSTHGDTALVEGICSLRAFYHLVQVGVPFPHDPTGAFIGYKTDHDPYERATSAGPKTSRFMSQKLQARAEELGVQITDGQVVLDFITSGEGADRRIVAMVTLDRQKVSNGQIGIAVFLAENWVLAAGGPGEIYRTTVYPRGQIGIHGPAFKAGLEACNLTESQFGLGSIKFRWNVSGSYMQVVPRIFSTDSEGRDEREFLTEYFDDMSTMATNIFLKGYQWPFDAQRIVDHQSSLIDIAVHQETVVRGRRVWMDFLSNPVGADGWDEFRIEDLGDEPLQYLRKTAALQETPIHRLEHMNRPAVEIFAENDIDLTREPLEIALCAQHMNGGFAVNKWWESNLRHTFVVGEMAGTHGVKRPGGAALNAGQVGSLRAAQYIANVYSPEIPGLPSREDIVEQSLAEMVDRVREILDKGATAKVIPAEALGEIGQRMTRYGAHLRSRAGATKALDQAKRQLEQIHTEGLIISSAKQLISAVVTEQQVLTHLAILKAICGMFQRGAGSRGSHCILDESGIEMHPKLIDPETDAPCRFKAENEELRGSILHVRYDASADDLFELHDVEVRPIPEREVAFEPAWAEFREGKIYEM